MLRVMGTALVGGNVSWDVSDDNRYGGNGIVTGFLLTRHDKPHKREALEEVEGLAAQNRVGWLAGKAVLQPEVELEWDDFSQTWSVYVDFFLAPEALAQAEKQATAQTINYITAQQAVVGNGNAATYTPPEAEGKGSGKTKIIVAVISAAAVVLAALIGLFASWQQRPGEATRPPDTGTSLAQSYKTGPDNPEAEKYNLMGVAAVERGDYEAALEHYTAAIALDGEYGVYYYNRGRVYRRLAQWELAVADLERALELNPTDADFQRELASAYRNSEA